MKKQIFYIITFIFTIYLSSTLAYCDEREYTVHIDGIDNPTWEEFGKIDEVPLGFSLWHYSSGGGYWGYSSGSDSLKIKDSNLNGDPANVEELTNATEGTISFEYYIPDEIWNQMEEDTAIKIYLSTTGPISATEPSDSIITVDDLFTNYEAVPTGRTIKFTATPKIYFEKEKITNFIDDPYGVNVPLPIANPNFGYNTYAIWKRTSAVDYNLGYGSFNRKLITDPNDPVILNSLVDGSGVSTAIVPSQIKNSYGHLRDGFDFYTWNSGVATVRNSSNASVGYYTLKGGGAVGVNYVYPIGITIYPAIPPNDILVDEYLVPDSAVENQEVLVGFEVESSFAGDLNDVNYQWSVTDTSGNVLTDEDGFEVSVDFLGDTPDEDGLFSVLSSTGNKIAYAKFVMPDKDVNIRFVVNEAGDNPVEIDTTDNVVEVTIANVLPIVEYGDFTIDYDILNMDVEFPVSDSALSVTLSKGSSYSWIGTTSGGLDLDTVEYPSIYPSYCPDLFQNVEFDGDDIGAYSVSVSLNPTIETTFSRKSFDDNPEDEDYSSEYNALRQGAVTYSGGISRKAKRNKYSKTPPYQKTGTKTVTKSGSFPSGSKEVEVNTLIYNGDNYIYPEYFDENIENNTYYDLSKNLFWTTEPYDFSAIRWMYDMDKNGNRLHPTAVPTQYPRTFTNQGTGEIDISIEESLQFMYDNAISAASSKSQDAGDYEHAVFATDKYLQEDYDYPIKSGYYFNPAGSYTFEIETVTYKTTTGETTDHQELVDSLVDSFRYETDLVYIDSSKEAVDIQGDSISASYNSYEGSSAVLSVADSTSIDNVSLLNVVDKDDDPLRYELTEEEIEYSTSSVSGTDTLFKQILEGYSESSSYDSYTNYKYREFIEGGQKLYRITEKSTVTIQVNPYDRDLYTHVNMQDGDYYIKVWFDSIDLSTSSHAFNTLGVLDGVDELDYMEIHVEGSIFDDVN